ncbi:ABC transporter ATP-binding protein [Desulfopila sp. IMCC35006]|uniref:ABC transporter ATP-binding protein n=1 Tax=Desulfopila sp. IMCC35006 TaxID=2569542 RepID=UPI0010ABB96F|nr:ABC transporter ATP-binding protein [Desulfopila sp. IMCC35006]TKB25371.1 ABC transporter ATP-binding protein [Desulfopila sp. IMCC35006]
MNDSGHLLDVKDLTVSFPSPRGEVCAVKNVSFSLGHEKIGIVGESGSGKSVTGRAILRLLPPYAHIHATAITFQEKDLLSFSEQEMRRIRGRQISMVMQDPKYSLNPVRTVGEQIREAYTIHRKVPRRQARQQTLEMLTAVRIRNPEQVYRLYPHEVSGGMGQRIMIAMMLIPEPSLLIADEPTSALDVTVQLQVLAILDDLVTQRGMGLIFISHDLELVASFCDRIIIMYGGRIMEVVDAANLHQSTHPYTRGLLNCLPRIDGDKGKLSTLQRDASWLDADFSATAGGK